MRAVVANAKDLDERERLFVSAFVETGDPVQSARDVGYSESSARHARDRLLPQAHISRAVAFAVRARLASSTPMALRVIETIAKDDTLPAKVRLDAAKTLLDRAGHVAPRPEAPDKASETPLHEMSVDQLKDLAARLGDELAGRAKVINSASASATDTQAIDLVG